MSKFKRSNASSDNEIKDSVRFQDFLSNMIAYFLMKFRKIGHTYTTITGRLSRSSKILHILKNIYICTSIYITYSN